MKLNGRRCIVCLLAWFLCASPGALRAEVSALIQGPSAYLLIMGIIEDPDPIPHLLWEPVRDIDPAYFLNASGVARGDGPPDAGYDQAAGRPLVVWAYNRGSENDIAFAQWSDGIWENTSFLAVTPGDELDPRIFVEPDGTVQVVWWVAGSPSQMRRLMRAAGSSVWSGDELIAVAGQPGRRPSVAMWRGSFLVAYERNTAQGQEVMVAERVSPGVYTTVTVASTDRMAPLDPVLHMEGGQLWLDWKQSANQIAYSVWQGGVWTPPQVVVWNDPSWFGEQGARELARSAVLGQ